MMKKSLLAGFALICIVALVLAGCTVNSEAPQEGYISGLSNNDSGAQYAPDGTKYGYTSDTAEQGGSTTNSAGNPLPEGQKIITGSNMQVETLKYIETVNAVKAACKAVGGYIFEAQVQGVPTGENSLRRADYTFKIPKDKLVAFKTDVEKAGNLVTDEVTSQDITSDYTDTELRLKSKKAYRDNLMKLYEKAKTLEDMVMLQDKIATEDTAIEQLEGQIKQWDDKLEYSAVNVSIYEVKDLTVVVEAPTSFWANVGKTFVDSCNALIKFLKEAFVVFVGAVPFLAVICVIALVILLIVGGISRRARKTRKAKKNLVADTLTQKEEEKLELPEE